MATAGDVVRVKDRSGAPIALATSLPGERERPCELITAPIASGHEATLRRYLAIASDLGFTVPKEAAVHLHFDAGPLRRAATFRTLVLVLDAFGADLRAMLGTNPACRRLGRQPTGLMDAVLAPGFAALGWDDAVARLRPLELTKYADVNLRNVVHGNPDKPTLEVRILPGTMEAGAIVAGARFFEALIETVRADGGAAGRCAGAGRGAAAFRARAGGVDGRASGRSAASAPALVPRRRRLGPPGPGQAAALFLKKPSIRSTAARMRSFAAA